jgi:predicted ATP-dependent endonuclease of OLD family
VNSLKLVSLQIDDTHIHFKDGLNYIVGDSNSGKTTVFNCIRYALGLTKSIVHRQISQIGLEVCINGYGFEFRREVGSAYLSVFHKGEDYKYRAQSKELDEFLREVLSPTYIYGGDTESVLAMLDFCFLSEERSANRRQKWEAINSICGINVSLIRSVEKDINALKKEVSKNKELENIVDKFSKSLAVRLNERAKIEDLDNAIELTKERFFDEFREKEYLLINATSKLEKIKEQSDFELRSKVAEIEDVFFSLNQYAGFERSFFDGLESFIKDRSTTMSYGEEIFSRFILVLAVAKVAEESRYNFPQLIVNDSYLSFDLDHRTYKKSFSIIDDLMSRNRVLQYIEFTYKDEVPKEHVVLNLNVPGGVHVFDS